MRHLLKKRHVFFGLCVIVIYIFISSDYHRIQETLKFSPTLQIPYIQNTIHSVFSGNRTKSYVNITELKNSAEIENNTPTPYHTHSTDDDNKNVLYTSRSGNHTTGRIVDTTTSGNSTKPKKVQRDEEENENKHLHECYTKTPTNAKGNMKLFYF